MEKHIIKQLAQKDAFVLVLNTAAKIDAQAEAMLQALHSRSTGGICAHLDVLQKKGAQNFMEKFYVGYGHKSIGDCGSATVFVEGISLLAAKAIQDWRLYAGQESSTRYIDFSCQHFCNPLETKEGERIMEQWRTFYCTLQEPLQAHLKKQFPISPKEQKTVYEKAIAARAFDIARAFLPAGVTTNVAWHMNLRQFADELLLLRHHPLSEVQDIAQKTTEALAELYPQSFGHKRYPETERYNHTWMQDEYYYRNHHATDFSLLFNFIDKEILATHKKQMQNRPPKTELPPTIAEAGVIGYEFLLDFGSYRDLQRHRATVQRMPLLTREHGFEQWYIQSLPQEMHEDALSLIAQQEKAIAALDTTDEIAQYYTPIGYRVPCRIVGDLKALVYLVELRATRFVHPTLVAQVTKMIDSLEELFHKDGLIIYRDDQLHRFDAKRGEHDIVMK